MRRRALLAVFVALLLVGAYGAYVVSYPKYPEVKGCVNPFAITKPVSRVQENWSKAHMFFKLATTRDFWKLAKPWDVDYSHVKIVKHTIEYDGERITMLAMGIPLKDKKHVIAIYEFSKPVQGVKVTSKEFLVHNETIFVRAIGVNGDIKPLSDCTHECSSDADCGFMCMQYCCRRSYNIPCMISCCGACGFAGDPARVFVCVLTICPWCYEGCNECVEYGSWCMDLAP
ncbi:hypothetical protein [Thermococcus sp. MV11]|uniref:hypothetical protein n=1 Tax=Thermococcus sp. MV11 TaxID=1638267 RepID=UPI001431AF23|nr:hypothetical protein [Thermococcus sp. MV11]NJE03037.1 hypothetical protein [Thermococcus sp. MV11]